MSTANDFHEKAMELADQAFLTRRNGNIEAALGFTRQALQFETMAADIFKNSTEAEPTRSVLYRSAAALALDCEEFREAERLVSIALSGEPPFEIAEELRDLLEQANFMRHLRLRNVDLTAGELQLSIAGSVVGHGIALSHELIQRIKDLERLIYRTVERLGGRYFRERGSTDKSTLDDYSLYVAVPRPGSFAVTLRLGRQRMLPGFDLSNDVITEVLECFELLNSGEEKRLQEKIPEEPYFHNFVGLAKRIAPDGERVRLVGLTKVDGNAEVRVALTRTVSEISGITSRTSKPSEGEAEAVCVTGRLLLADARKATRKIQLIEDDGTAHTIVVPEGIMDDIVKPLWDEVVTVRGMKFKSKVMLQEIAKAE